MTIEEVLEIIKGGRIAAIIIRGNNEDDIKFNQENIEALNVIVETLRKYQKIEEIYKNWSYGADSCDCMKDIERVLEDGNDD